MAGTIVGGTWTATVNDYDAWLSIDRKLAEASLADSYTDYAVESLLAHLQQAAADWHLANPRLLACAPDVML